MRSVREVWCVYGVRVRAGERRSGRERRARGAEVAGGTTIEGVKCFGVRTMSTCGVGRIVKTRRVPASTIRRPL
jgi:hypothetical protein